MWHKRQISLVASIGAALLSGCSTVTPDFHALGQKPNDQWLSEQRLINHIQCELVRAVRAVDEYQRLNEHEKTLLPSNWVDKWGAKVSLVLAVNNKDNLSPGLSLNAPLENALSVFKKNGNVTTSQNRAVGLSGTWSSDATRTETIGFSYSFADLLASSIDPSKCKASEGLSLASDLKITDFLMKGVSIASKPGMIYRPAGGDPYQTFTYEVKFIVTASGSVNPTWKLLRVSVGPPSGSLYTLSQVHTDDLLITMGKVTDPKAAAEFDAQHNANLIGQAVANALRNNLPQ